MEWITKILFKLFKQFFALFGWKIEMKENGEVAVDANISEPVPNETEEQKQQREYAVQGEVERMSFILKCTVLNTVFLILILFSFLLPIPDLLEFGEEKVGISIGMVLLCVQIVYTIASLRTQQQNEVGGIFQFGRFLFQTKPGLLYVPPFICSLQKVSSNEMNIEIPKDTPWLYPELWEPGSDGKVQNKTLRMTTAFPKKDETDENDPLQTGRLTLEGTIALQIKLDSKPGAFRQFIEQVGSIRNFIEITDDSVVTAVRRDVVNKTPSEVFKKWKRINTNAEQQMDRYRDGCGFSKMSVKVKGFDLPKRVNEALADRTSAHVGVETGRLKGKSKGEELREQAVGERAAAAASSQGLVDALILAQKSKEDGGLGFTEEQALAMLGIQQIREGMEKSTYAILPGSGQPGSPMDPATTSAYFTAMQQAFEQLAAKKKETATKVSSDATAPSGESTSGDRQ